MGGINMPRVFLGGLLAAAIYFVLEGVAGLFYMDSMTAALEAHGLSMEMSMAGLLIPMLVSWVAGTVMIWFYAAARPRLGPGPATAVKVAVALWLGGYLLSLMGYGLLGIFDTDLLVLWRASGLVESVLACLAGAWVYRESAAG